MIHPDDLSAMQAALALLEETGQAEAEYRQRTRGGDYRWVSNHMKLTRDDAGRPLYRDGNIRDVTDRKKTEEQLEGSISQLELANKELESFSYSVSHDLRAPLRAIDGFSSMLMKTLEGKLDQEERRRFDLIRDNTKKMNHLIEDLLALSRAGRFELTLKKIDVNKLVNSVWKQEQEAHPEIAVALKTGDLPEAVGDRSLLWQVFSNLLANAVKFTRKRKKAVVEVGGEIRDTENIYYVKDNGTGFDMKYYEKLFGVFQRLHPENEYEGTGVGLAIVQRIIHRHGGRIWAEGKVGKGAIFYFSLPAANSK